MPHLQFEINKTLNSEERDNFIEFAKNTFSEVMKTGAGHIAISLREFPLNALSLGRAKKNEFVCLMNLDLREGRSVEQKRELVRKYMEGVENFFKISKENQYLTFTSHVGNDFNLFEKSLEEWLENDEPIPQTNFL